jgi:hypothetical protein
MSKMTDEFDSVIELLRMIHANHPEQRIGQVLWNTFSKSGYLQSSDCNWLKFMDDCELIRMLEKYLK